MHVYRLAHGKTEPLMMLSFVARRDQGSDRGNSALSPVKPRIFWKVGKAKAVRPGVEEDVSECAKRRWISGPGVTICPPFSVGGRDEARKLLRRFHVHQFVDGDEFGGDAIIAWHGFSGQPTAVEDG